MGGVTPVWGIRYPFQHEVENPIHFEQFADDVDAALDLLDVAGAAALGGAHVIVQRTAAGAPTMAAAASSTLQFSTAGSGDEVPSTMWAVGSPANIVLPTPGLYLASLRMAQFSPVTTVTSQELTVFVNGVAAARRKYDKDPVLNGVSAESSISAVVRCTTAGHVLTFSFRWTGTGGPANQPQMTGFVTRLVDLS